MKTINCGSSSLLPAIIAAAKGNDEGPFFLIGPRAQHYAYLMMMENFQGIATRAEFGIPFFLQHSEDQSWLELWHIDTPTKTIHQVAEIIHLAISVGFENTAL